MATITLTPTTRSQPVSSIPKKTRVHELALVDTCILFRATAAPSILKNVRKLFIPCITDIVESELEHLCFLHNVSLTAFLKTWAKTRRVPGPSLGDFLKKQEPAFKKFLISHYNDARIGLAAFKAGIKVIITDNKKDFIFWEKFGIQVLSYKDVLSRIRAKYHKTDQFSPNHGTSNNILKERGEVSAANAP